MKGARANYGKGAEGLRITLRLYDEARQYVEKFALARNISTADALINIVSDHSVLIGDQAGRVILLARARNSQE
jgi:hypothetical protein